MSARENRRQRDKKPMLPFGDLMLPIIGLIAVGLLIVGIKFFFLSGPVREAHKPVIAQETTNTTPTSSTPSPVAESSNTAISAQPLPEPSQQGSSGKITTAGPVVSQEAPTQTAPSTGVAAPVSGSSQSVAVPRTKDIKPVLAQEGQWGVQIGSFKNAEAAEGVKQKVTKQGYTAFVSKAVVKNATYYRVTVTGNNNRDEAETQASRLKQAGYPVLIVRLR